MRSSSEHSSQMTAVDLLGVIMKRREVVSRRDAKKQAFYQALRDSVSALIEEGEAGGINQSQVIKNAKFSNGKKVGETTLYSKNSKTGYYIHREFMVELDGLIRNANKGVNKVARKTLSTSEKLNKKRSDYAELQAEYDSVLAQFALMMQNNNNINKASNENRVRALEADLYLVASLLIKNIDVEIPEITNVVRNYEKKYSGQNRLALVQDRVSRLERIIRDSQVISIFDKVDGDGKLHRLV